MPGILKTHEADDQEQCCEGEGEGGRGRGEGVTEQKKETAGRISNGGGKGEEEREGSSTTCSTPDAAGKHIATPLHARLPDVLCNVIQQASVGIVSAYKLA